MISVFKQMPMRGKLGPEKPIVVFKFSPTLSRFGKNLSNCGVGKSSNNLVI